MCIYLPTEGGTEATVECQITVSPHHVDSHPHHPNPYLLLCLQVHLETPKYEQHRALSIKSLSAMTLTMHHV